MVRLGLMVLAVVIVLSAVGINLSALAIFSGAVGVGIGFGLQKIVANFISGVILLADKSVKPGDLVTIGDSSGRISAMNTRYISVAAGDGREFLIPNEDLITQKVVNWTYTDKNTLVKVNFSTNYDADPRLVCKLAIEAAEASPRATKGKPPNCIITEFAEAGMKFTLTFWIADPDGMDKVQERRDADAVGRLQARTTSACPIRSAKSASAAARCRWRPRWKCRGEADLVPRTQRSA